MSLLSRLKAAYYKLPRHGLGRAILAQGYFLLLGGLNAAHSWSPFAISRLILRAAGMKIHPTACVHRQVRFLAFGNVTLAEGSTINDGCLIDNRQPITIGKSVSIAHGVSIYTTGHDLDDPGFKMKGKTVTIEDHVCIFANAMIMPGVTLETGAVVFPGAVVTKSVPKYAIVGGNPARFIRERSRNLDYRLDTGFWLMV